ncbi:MAG: PaaX family transcriptional regulator C-terminal domain-containing protein [Sulfitobacter sp.]
MDIKLHDTDACIAALIEGEQIKVWSYITTIFGDMASADQGGARVDLSGQMLTTLTERIGIKAQAMRVALHRLRKDDWIMVRKEGRASHYRLSNERLAETLAAGARIYAPHVQSPAQWHLSVADPALPLDVPRETALALSPNCMLSRSAPTLGPAPLGAMIAHETLPDWVRESAMRPEWNAEYAALAALFSGVLRAIEGMGDMPLLDQVTLRLLVVHRWRRLILRHPAIAEEVQAPTWQGRRTRAAAAALFAHLPSIGPDTTV